MEKQVEQKPGAYKFKGGDHVVYIDPLMREPQYGEVSSINDEFVFVKFYKELNLLGWKGTTSQACRPERLRKED